MHKLTGKVAVVTGASKGIGADIAKGLADEGASVVVNYSSSKQGADKVVSEITRRGGKAITVQGDVADESDVKRIFDETKRAFGRLDILVNNAGVYQMAPLLEITEDQFHRLFNINVLGLLLATREAVTHFGREGGSIINIGSSITSTNPPNSVIYAATKGAVDSITHVLAKNLAHGTFASTPSTPDSSRPKAPTPLASSVASGKRGVKRKHPWGAPVSPATSPRSPSSSHPPTQAGSPARSSSPPVVSASRYSSHKQ